MNKRPAIKKRKIDMNKRITKMMEIYWHKRAEPYIHWQILERANDDFMSFFQPQEFIDALNAFKIQH